ncbi:hypothetical protein C9I94_10750 [Photobacterium swingsii]|uniref:Phage tail protein n=1 Tax=Photobacterium swingsii TaxID=680026 RepID=A0A2T3P7D8_9GAMM|nr:hypothetical protein [Photobacterium swingsii]PSW24507.1 hypothetical protein C9I94_10750 [Photobacterium swingsii]
MATNWYRTGTISVTANSKSVVGVGTKWIDAGNKPLAGDILVLGGEFHEIETITDNEHLSLFTPFSGSTGKGLKYAVIRNTSLNISSRIAASVSRAINSKQQLLNEIDDFLTSNASSVVIHNSFGEPMSFIPLPKLTSILQTNIKNIANLQKIYNDAVLARDKSKAYADHAAKNLAETKKVKSDVLTLKGDTNTIKNETNTIKNDTAKIQAETAKIRDEAKTIKSATVHEKELAHAEVVKAATEVSKATAEVVKAKSQVAAAKSEVVKAKAEKTAAAGSASAAANSVTQAQGKVATATILVAKAREWAEKQHLHAVETDPKGAKHFSSLHWAQESQAAADSAGDSETEAKAAQSAVNNVKKSVVAMQKAIAVVEAGVKSDLSKSKTLTAQIQAQQAKVIADIADEKKRHGEIKTIAAQVTADKKNVASQLITAANMSRVWNDAGNFTPTAKKEYPAPPSGSLTVLYTIRGITGANYEFKTGVLKGVLAKNSGILLGFKTSSGWLWEYMASIDGSAFTVTINNKTGRNIKLTAADLGTLTSAQISSSYRTKSDYNFTAKDLEIANKKILSHGSQILVASASANHFGSESKQLVLHTKAATSPQIVVGRTTKTLATTQDITSHIATSALKIDGSNQMDGTVTFKGSRPQNIYDLVNLSTGARGAKNLLRKFRGGNGDTIWHETVTGGHYRLATGTTDSVEILRLDSTGGWLGGHQIFTKGYKPTAADVGALTQATADGRYLGKTAKAVDSAKLEGKTKAQVVAEARSGYLTAATAKTSYLPINGKAADSAKLEGKTKSEVIAEARSGYLTASSATTKFLGKTSKAVDSAKLEGKTKAQVVAEARSGYLTSVSATSKFLGKTSKAADANLLDGINSNGFCRAYSGSTGTGAGNWTTDQFVTWLKSKGAFNQPYWVMRGSWDYAGNKKITDTGIGIIHLSGCVIEVIGTVGNYTIRITTPTTSSGGVNNAQYTYVNNGPTYSPSWHRDYNTTYKPTAADVGALTQATADGRYLGKTAKAVDSAKLEGKTKAQVVAEARSGYLTSVSATSKFLGKTSKAADSAKLEGKTKSQVIAEARSGYLSATTAKSSYLAIKGKATDSAKLEGKTKAQIVSDARSGLASTSLISSKIKGKAGKGAPTGSDIPAVGGLFVRW